MNGLGSINSFKMTNNVSFGDEIISKAQINSKLATGNRLARQDESLKAADVFDKAGKMTEKLDPKDKEFGIEVNMQLANALYETAKTVFAKATQAASRAVSQAKGTTMENEAVEKLNYLEGSIIGKSEVVDKLLASFSESENNYASESQTIEEIIKKSKNQADADFAYQQRYKELKPVTVVKGFRADKE